jgi:hypothetical protein
MPLFTVSAGAPILAPGTYPATVIGIAPKKLNTKFSQPGVEDDFLEWTWLVEGPEQDVEITSLTSVATGPKSAIVRYLTALLGAGNFDVGQGFEENDLVGKKAQVVIVEKEGFSKIENVVASPVASRRGAAAPAAPAAVAPSAKSDDLDDDLPF